MTTTGQRFKEIRQALKLSQDDFGAELGLSSQGVSNIEKDKSFLALEKLQTLEKFNVNLNFLIYGIGQPFIPPKYNDVKDEIMKEVEEMLRKRGIR